MTTYGLTPQGFVPKSYDVIVAEIGAAQRATIDATLDTSSAESVIGQLNASISERLAEVWEDRKSVV